jgi:gamma-glutamyltranspeptidase/glutathione hydrolase
VVIAGLADSLRTIAAEGPGSFYSGTIGAALVDLMETAGGHVSSADLAGYRALDRTPITVDLDGWTVATNPGPAIGGAVTAALLMLMDATGLDATTREGSRRLAEVQRAVLRHRSAHLDIATDRTAAVERLLAEAGDHLRFLESPSTVNVSAVDNAGLACAITTSAGYGSGVMIPGTGLWLNNSLGEIELHPADGLESLPAGPTGRCWRPARRVRAASRRRSPRSCSTSSRSGCP